MGNGPILGGGVAEEASFHVVVHAARGHPVQRVEHDVLQLLLARRQVAVDQQLEGGGVGKLGSRAETAVPGVKAIGDPADDPLDDRGGKRPLRRAQSGSPLGQLGDLRLELLPAVGPGRRHLPEEAPHGLRWEVRAAGEDLARRREEGGRGPAAHVVAPIDVRAAVIVDLHRDIGFLDQPGHLGIAVGGPVHDMAPVAPHRADVQQDGHTTAFRLLECLVTPLAPPDALAAQISHLLQHTRGPGGSLLCYDLEPSPPLFPNDLLVRPVTPESRLASSIGTTNFVEGDDPICFNASRYCKLMVFASTPLATSKILPRARENPSARRMAACRSPSADRMAACFCPSASVTTARRVRSADIWRVIASCTVGGGMISRTSTLVTFTPHRSVTSSSLTWRIWFISSRLDRTSSRVMSPTTLRSVVAAILSAAPAKFCTWRTDIEASTTL